MPGEELPSIRFNKVLEERGIPPLENNPWDVDHLEDEPEEDLDEILDGNGDVIEMEVPLQRGAPPQGYVVIDSDGEEEFIPFSPHYIPTFLPGVRHLDEIWKEMHSGRQDTDTEDEDSDPDASHSNLEDIILR